MSHDELVAALKLAYPNTEHGADYIVGHPIGPDGRQIADAYIIKWKMDAPEPSVASVWDKYGTPAAAAVLDELTRRERYSRLVEADQLVEKARDQENETAAPCAWRTAARSWRRRAARCERQPRAYLRKTGAEMALQQESSRRLLLECHFGGVSQSSRATPSSPASARIMC